MGQNLLCANALLVASRWACGRSAAITTSLTANVLRSRITLAFSQIRIHCVQMFLYSCLQVGRWAVTQLDSRRAGVTAIAACLSQNTESHKIRFCLKRSFAQICVFMASLVSCRWACGRPKANTTGSCDDSGDDRMMGEPDVASEASVIARQLHRYNSFEDDYDDLPTTKVGRCMFDDALPGCSQVHCARLMCTATTALKLTMTTFLLPK